MTMGYNRTLYLLPFDHRASIQTALFGCKGTLATQQTTRVEAAKQVVYKGHLASLWG